MISDVYDSMVEAFRIYGCPAQVLLGEQYAWQHTGMLTVILWQTDDRYAPQIPSVPQGPMTNMGAINPRPVATRKCGAVARLWATAPEQRDPVDQYRANLAYLDALINQTIVVLQQLTSGIYVAQGGRSPEGNAGSVIAGLGYDLAFSVDVPIIDTAWPAQALSDCTRTWIHRPARAIVSIDGKVDPNPPYYQTGTQFEVPTPDQEP